MAFKDGGTVKKLAPGQGTVPGAPAPINPGSTPLGSGFQPEIAPAPGTSTVNSGPMQAPNGASDNVVQPGSPLSFPEAPSSGVSGGTVGDSIGAGQGKPAYAPGKGNNSIQYNPAGRSRARRSERGQQGNSGGPAPLIRPEPAPPGNVPKGGPIIPKGAPKLGPMPTVTTMRPKGK